MKLLLIFFLLVSTLSAGIGEVTAAKGAVSLIRKGFSRSVSVGLELLQKDRILTKKRSKAQVILNDDTVVTIGPNSSYHFLEYTETKDPEVLMQIDHGFFKAVTGKIGKIAPHRFKIKTRAASIGIRGTQFMAHVETDSEEIACVQGSIIVTTLHETFVVPAGKMLIYKNGEWSMQSVNLQIFAPVVLAEEDDLSLLFREIQLRDIDGDALAQEQLIKQRLPLNTPEVPFELFDTPLDPVTVTPNTYELRTTIDNATPPPPFMP